MAVGLSEAVANAQLDTIQSTVHVLRHTGDPGATGSSNQASDTTRVAATLQAAASAGRTMASPIEWPVWSAGVTQTISHISFWDSPTGGVMLFSALLAEPQELSDGKIIELLSFDISHVTLAS